MKPLVEVLTTTAAWFKERGIPSARLDAELLIGHVLGLDRVKVYLSYDRPLTDDELERLRPLVRRRGNREPLAWILGEKEFYGHDFIVTPGVLVPRPDTETLVEAALEWLSVSPPPGDKGPPHGGVKASLPWSSADAAEVSAPTDVAPDATSPDVTGPDVTSPGATSPGGVDAPAEPPIFVADIGSGTGCIGLTLALERPAVRLFAVDRSEEALAATRANVVKHGLEKRVAVLRGDLLSAIPAARTIDWIVSNPPYIPSRDIDGLLPEVRDHEPRGALDGGPDGLDVYRALIPAAAARARKGVLVEVGAGQAADVAALLTAAGLPEVRIWKDLAGVERVVGGRRA
ncbi:MAG: HemK/PrmC family methyltransferase [Pseudomonadota bacterium]|nr:HemK/PrmC family methyltransferase [Pseudomonadota bacterium]